MWILGLALRNLARNVRRTLITSVAVVAGVAIQILGWGMVDGLDENVLRAAAYTTTGDLLLRPDGYPDDGFSFPLADAKPPPDLAGKVDGVVAGRVMFPSRMVRGADAVRVMGIAYDGRVDPEVFPRENWRIDGRWPEPGQPELVVGAPLAELLALKAGDEVFLEARTPDGAMNAVTYRIVGMVKTDNAQLDNTGAWIEMGAADQLLQLGERRTHLAVKLRSGSPEAARDAVAGTGWYARTTRDEVADLLAANTIRRRAIAMLVFVIMAIAATGIANTVIMAAYERVREIGTLLALGMTRGTVARMFLFEGGVLGVVAGVAGAILGSALVLHWQEAGIDLSGATQGIAKDLSMSAYLYTKFQWPPVFLALFFSLAISVGASVQPARFAARLNPADAVRAD